MGFEVIKSLFKIGPTCYCEIMLKGTIKEAVEFGIDISLLKERLRWTPTQRLQRHFEGLAFALELKKVYQKQDDRVRTTNKKAV